MTIRTVTLLSVATVVLGIAGAGAALGQDGSPAPSNAATATPDPSGGAIPMPTEAGAALDPGRYVDMSLGRDISFEIGTGWTGLGSEPTAGVALVRDAEDGPYVAIAPFDGGVFNAPCRTVENGETFGHDPALVDTTAEAFVSHLAAHPFLTVSEPEPVTIGGLSGLQVDATTSVPAECDPPWAWLWTLPVYGDYHLSDGVAARLVALEDGGDVIVLVIEVAPDQDLASLMETGMALLDSIEIGEPASAASPSASAPSASPTS